MHFYNQKSETTVVEELSYEYLLYVNTVQPLQTYFRCLHIPPFYALLSATTMSHISPIRINFFPHHMLLSLYNKNHIGLKWKRKHGIWGNVASISFFSPSAISGNWYLRPHFAPRPSLLEMSFLSAQKTAEAVEMELVVCRCMREWDYPGVMSALLNTITLHRSERDPRRIYCLLNCVWRWV